MLRFRSSALDPRRCSLSLRAGRKPRVPRRSLSMDSKKQNVSLHRMSCVQSCIGTAFQLRLQAAAVPPPARCETSSLDAGRRTLASGCLHESPQSHQWPVDLNLLLKLESWAACNRPCAAPVPAAETSLPPAHEQLPLCVWVSASTQRRAPRRVRGRQHLRMPNE